MSKPFFYRITAADLLDFATDPEGEGMTLLRFAKELQKGESDVEFIQSVIDEAKTFSDRKRAAANKRWSNKDKQTSTEDMQVDAVHSTAMPEAVTVTEAEAVTESKSKHLSGKPDAYTEAFLEFWKEYPKKTGKGEAFKSWKKVKAVNHLGAIISTLSWQKPSNNWQAGYIPNPSTYLNQRRWEDEPTESPTGSMSTTPQSGRFREDDL